MCIPHGTKTFKSSKREKKIKTKSSGVFDKKLLEPDLEFIDERVSQYIPQTKSKSLIDKLLSILS